MEFTKENIFVLLLTLIVVSGGIHVRLSDSRYTAGKNERGAISVNKPVIGQNMAVRGLSCGSTVATEGSMMYLLVNDSCTIQYDFKAKIQSVNFNSGGIAVAVSDTIYRISYDADSAMPNNFASSVPPISVASLQLFSQSVTSAQ